MLGRVYQRNKSAISVCFASSHDMRKADTYSSKDLGFLASAWTGLLPGTP